MPARRRDEAVPNHALYNLRDARGETQEQVADAINRLASSRGESPAFTGNQVSRWERGTVRPSRFAGQLLAEHFGVSIADLGLTQQRVPHLEQKPQLGGLLPAILATEDPMQEREPEVINSQREWLHVRRSLGRHQPRLSRAAASLYPEEFRLSSTGLLALPEWAPTAPIDLADVRISFDAQAAPPMFNGSEDVTAHVRPLESDGRLFQRYSRAIRDVSRPTLFENRYCWRLLEASFTDSGGALRFGGMHYFDAMDTCEALAHEFASVHVGVDDRVNRGSWRGLRFRKEIGSPFDLSRRPAIMSINTLTIRRDKTSASVVLHNRNSANVATTGGVIGVMPAGVFQPSSVRSDFHPNDFNLWRNIMREYSEEFLGNAEHDGDGPGADYMAEPLRSLDLARQSGGISLYAFGLYVGALDFWGGLETVAVIDADVFDELFAGMVRVNAEGTVVRVGSALPTVHIPFTREVIGELQATDRLAPETSLSLEKAWEHRDLLLAR